MQRSREKGDFRGNLQANRARNRRSNFGDQSFQDQLPSAPQTDETFLVGRNEVKEALLSQRAINKLWILSPSEGRALDGRLAELRSIARERGIPVLEVKRTVLDRMVKDQIHQGVVAQVAAADYADPEAVLASVFDQGRHPFVLILDGLQDGRNLGAALRVAECCAVDLVVIPERRSVSLDQYVAKASAGAIEYVPVARVTNLTQFVEDLKEKGFWIYGTAADGSISFQKADLTGSTALVIGSEGKGISAKLKEHCDGLLSIPMWGNLNSLNASVACGIVCWEAARQRHLDTSGNEGTLVK